ncbi:GNAT family N-acetyltransferase [Cellulomonas edaphi]|uniref:GNAT family N-acetyltransferase n=1 Tax=Cellulomonas edaphi TaxID=3053468 RepID=A0ABT7S7Q8_9CELL|nr:GNAT family N-acetyltransferase [Cellulomons edaphi]MDM7831067.1 GNAT family N-acetyltransferase [Cellulomons edaphi]
MRPGVHVSAARPEDLDSLVELCLAARAESAVGAQLCTDDAERLRDQLGALLAVPGGLALMGTVDGVPAGMLLARLVGPSLFTDVVSLNLEAVYVVPDARRRGLGHMLLSAATQQADEAGAADVYATPLPGSRGMQRFLARLGFAPAAAHRVVATSALQRRLAHEGAPAAAGRRPSPRGLEDLIARRRQAREGRAASAAGDQATASISMQVNRAVQMRRPSASSTTTW